MFMYLLSTVNYSLTVCKVFTAEFNNNNKINNNNIVIIIIVIINTLFYEDDLIDNVNLAKGPQRKNTEPT